MDLTGLLLRAGAARPHVLIAAVPGGTRVRLAAEEQLRRRGWPAALTPADADVLLVAGPPARDIAGALEAVWDAIPAPRARFHAAGPGEVAAALDAARAELASGSRQRHSAAAGAGRLDGRHDSAVGHAMAGHGGHGMAGDGSGNGNGRDAGGDDAHGMAGGGHSGHGMGEREMPAGRPMADRGEDRDGLRLDQLHVPLGPVLPDWPAGLVLRLTLQGDVVQRAEPEILGGGGGSFWDEPWHQAAAGERVTAAEGARRGMAARLDSLSRFLAVAGWDEAAVTARRLRDDVLADASAARLHRDTRRLARRVARSRTLAWLTSGLGVLTAAEAASAGITGPALRAGGDVTARYRRWCADLEAATAALDDVSPLDPARLEPPRGQAADGAAASAGLITVLPRLLAGSEFAAARLIVASLDPDLDQVPARVEASRGG